MTIPEWIVAVVIVALLAKIAFSLAQIRWQIAELLDRTAVVEINTRKL